MRWNTPPNGTRKTVKKFAFLPVKIGSTRVWLEEYYEEWMYGAYRAFEKSRVRIDDNPENDIVEWGKIVGWFRIARSLID